MVSAYSLMFEFNEGLREFKPTMIISVLLYATQYALDKWCMYSYYTELQFIYTDVCYGVWATLAQILPYIKWKQGPARDGRLFSCLYITQNGVAFG